MTAAEQFKVWGRREGRQEAMKTIAINFLKDGVEPDFMAKNTGLDIVTVNELKL